MRDPTAELLKAMSSVGLHPKQIQWDGRFHRFPGIGQRGRGDNGWLKAYVDQRGAIFGDNRTKQYWKWPKDDAEWRESMKGLEPLSAAEVRAKQAEADAARAKAEEKAQKTVDALWADATDCTEHPYLIAKGIDSAPGLKVAPDKRGRPMLLIPMRNVDSKLKSIQRIWPDGRRLFIKHAPVKGLYTTIGAREFKRTGKKGALYVCEGWATGWSIHKATDGGAVVVAFSDHGLKVVGAIMRTKYPNARIVICADNDRFKSVPRDGENVNPGVHAARAAAKACDGEVAIPEFKSLEGKPTDFDDLRQREGPEAVRHRLDPKRAAEAVTEAWKPDPEPEPDPEPATKPDDDKKVVDGRLNDPRTFIAAGNAAGAEWYYDLRKDRPLRKAGDDWTEVKQRWSTDLAFQIGERVRRRDSSRHYHDIRYSDQMSRRLFVASLNRLERDPFRAWLEQIPPWDGIPALDKWLEILKPDGNLGLIRWAAANIVLLAIWRTYHPGTGCKQTVMLRGPSHGGKSSILECLLPPQSPEWFRGSLPMQQLSHSPKTVVEHCKGSVLVEWSEMAGIGGGRHQVDVESLKAFLSASRDSGVRFAYRRDPEDLPRNFVIVGTANRNVTLPNDRALLNRIAPVTCTATDKLNWRNRDQTLHGAEPGPHMGRGAHSLPRRRLPYHAPRSTDHRRGRGLEGAPDRRGRADHMG